MGNEGMGLENADRDEIRRQNEELRRKLEQNQDRIQEWLAASPVYQELRRKFGKERTVELDIEEIRRQNEEFRKRIEENQDRIQEWLAASPVYQELLRKFGRREPGEA